MHRKFLFVIAVLVAFASGSSTRAQAPGGLQKSSASAAIGSGTSPLPHLAPQDGYPDLPPLRFNDTYGEFISGVFVLPTASWVEVYIDSPVRGRSMIFIYPNGSCAGSRIGSADNYFYTFNRDKGYVLSVQAMYFFRLDDGTYINGLRGSCVQIVWDSERLAGLGDPATPIADNDGSDPAPNDVVALPNTGAGQHDGTPFLWLSIGAAVLISGFAWRWRTHR